MCVCPGALKLHEGKSQWHLCAVVASPLTRWILVGRKGWSWLGWCIWRGLSVGVSVPVVVSHCQQWCWPYNNARRRRVSTAVAVTNAVAQFFGPCCKWRVAKVNVTANSVLVFTNSTVQSIIKHYSHAFKVIELEYYWINYLSHHLGSFSGWVETL